MKQALHFVIDGHEIIEHREVDTTAPGTVWLHSNPPSNTQGAAQASHDEAQEVDRAAGVAAAQSYLGSLAPVPEDQGVPFRGILIAVGGSIVVWFALAGVYGLFLLLREALR